MTVWKSGRGALGVLKPLLGRWATETEGPSNFGTIRVTRRFETVLGGAWVRLDVLWALGGGKTYEEIALFGKGEDGALAFTSLHLGRQAGARGGTGYCFAVREPDQEGLEPLPAAPLSPRLIERRLHASQRRQRGADLVEHRADALLLRIDAEHRARPRSDSCR